MIGFLDKGLVNVVCWLFNNILEDAHEFILVGQIKVQQLDREQE